MAELNPIIQPNLNLERPIVKPESTVDIAGALAPLAGILVGAVGDATDKRNGVGVSAGDKKDQALRGYFQRLNDWSNSDMAPQDFQENARGLALAQMEATPQYRTDIMGGLEMIGVTAPVQPSSLDDAYNAQFNEYIQSPQGVVDMIASAKYTGGGLDNPATSLEVQKRFQQRQAEAAAAEARAMQLSRVEYDDKMYAAGVKQVVREIAPQWNAKSNDILRGVFEAASQGDPKYDTPMEQVQAITQFRMMAEMEIRDSALMNGITDPKAYEDAMSQALAPFNSVLNALDSKADAATNVLTAYQKANELGSAQMFMEALGPMFGGNPESIRAFSDLIVNSMYNDPKKLQGAFDYINSVADRGYDDMFTIFPDMPIDPAAAMSTEVKPDNPAFTNMDETEALNNINVASDLLLSQSQPDSQTTLMALTSIVAASNASDGGPVSGALLKKVLNPTTIRTISQLTGADKEEAQALLSNFVGEQTRRNYSLIQGLTSGTNYSVQMNDAGKFTVMVDGKEIGKPANVTGREKDIWQAVDNLNAVGSLTSRISEVAEPAKAYTHSLVTGQDVMGNTQEIETFLDRQPTEQPTATITGQAGQAELGGGALADTLAPTGFEMPAPEEAKVAETQAAATSKAVGTSVVPSYGYKGDAGFEQSVAAGRSSPYWNTAVDTARKYGIPEQILTRLITAESSWRADIGENSAGAAGIAQFLQSTADQFGIDRMNPEQAIDGAARYLQKEYNKYGRWDFALAAYNAGGGNVDKYGGVPPFQETQNYVNKILGGIGGAAGVGYSEYRTGANKPVDYQPVALPTNINARPGVLYANLDGASSMTKPYAADNMNFILNGPFQQMQALYGGELTINDAIAKAGTSREKDTKGSQHFHGNALDISLAGMSNEQKQKVFQSALAAGFTGFGFGDGILHVDIGPKRSWAYGNTSFGGIPLSDVQAMVAGSSNTQLNTGVDYSGGAQDRLILPSNYNLGKDADINKWIPDADPDEGDISSFVPVQDGDASGINEEAAASQAQAGEEALNVVDPNQSQGGQARPAASQGATTELTNRVKAVLQKYGASETDLQEILKLLGGGQ